MTLERWQEFDCAACGIDYDLHDDQMVTPGQSFTCPGCGNRLIATPNLVQEYCLDTGASGPEASWPMTVNLGTHAVIVDHAKSMLTTEKPSRR